MDWLNKITKDHKDYIAIAKKFGAGSFAEDIVQEMYIRLINHANLQKLLKDGKVNKIYIYWAIRNTYLMHKEKRKVNTDDLHLVYINNIDREEAYGKIYKKIEAEINSWHWYDKMLFDVYKESGKSIRELSKETNISVKSIWLTLKHCKKRIKEAIGEDWEDFQNMDYELIKLEK